ncbi:MAG TPA: hypothetical protein VFW05_14750 [Verrucomicrobiae bacterium]|nr:hypothetical protein [Verrucomicrobiae bacterium]
MNDYDRVASVIRYLDKRHADQPDLAALAKQVNLEPVLNFLKELSVHCNYIPALSWG